MNTTRPRHDEFFHNSLSRPIIGRDFFRQHLPEPFRKHLDLDQSIKIDRSHTDDKLQQRERDIIYKTRLRDKGTAFLCAEHQSYEQSEIPLRVLRYHADTTAMYLNEGNQQWPLVITLVFYHGLKAPYPYGSEVIDYYEVPALATEQLSFRFHVIDATQLSDEELLTHRLCAPMAVLLKHGRDGNFALDIAAYRDVFHACIAEVGDPYIFAMLSYADSLPDLSVGEKMHKFILKVLQEKEEVMMTYGQYLTREAREEGLLQGMQQDITKRYRTRKARHS